MFRSQPCYYIYASSNIAFFLLKIVGWKLNGIDTVKWADKEITLSNK